MSKGPGTPVGIEYLNIYGGRAFIEVNDIFDGRALDKSRADNLMMRSKTVGMPFEDSVTHAVNAAKPIIDRLDAAQRNAIELVVTASESGLDFGKSLATWVHKYLGLSQRCRVFEIKQACYGGTAALQMAAASLLAGGNPAAKSLVIATDMAWPSVKLSYAEPSQGLAAAAMLVGFDPIVLDIDIGASGLHSFEVLDTCRPDPLVETGDADLSLMAYLDCLEAAFRDYQASVAGADFQTSFDYLAFHTPFAGMVKGAHRNLMRRVCQARPEQIEQDFKRRLSDSLVYCQQVGNAYSATLFVALASLVDHASTQGEPYRVGLFSYGSGCSSEFFSGIVSAEAARRQATFAIGETLQSRTRLSLPAYDEVMALNAQWTMGVQTRELLMGPVAPLFEAQFRGRGLLTFRGVDNYRRIYDWS